LGLALRLTARAVRRYGTLGIGRGHGYDQRSRIGRTTGGTAIEGKTVDELAEAALRRGLEEQSWQDLLAYGRERGRASGYTEEDVPRIVKEWRREQRER
jgi:hypothetical protein